MRIEAKQVLAQKTYRLRYYDPDKTYRNRIEKLAVIKDNAIEFVNNVFVEFDLPNFPVFTAGALKGFEDAQRDNYFTFNGVLVVYGSFNTLSGHTIRMEIPIQISRGEFHRPSIMLINGKRLVISKDSVEALVETHEGTIPHARNPFSAMNSEVTHNPNVARPQFLPPVDPTGWSDLVVDKY